MKTRTILALLPLLGAAAWARTILIDPNQSGQVFISGTAATQIFTNDNAAQRSYVINASTCGVYLVGYSTTSARSLDTNATFSISATTGSFLLQGFLLNGTTIQPPMLNLDGPDDPFTGPVWGQSACATGGWVTRFRTH